MIGTVSFDGLSQGAIWTGQGGIAPHLQQRFINLGFSGEMALEITFTIGLLTMVGLISGLYRLGVLGMCSIGGGDATDLSRRFVHSLIPIALAYVVAHYFSLLSTRARRWPISSPIPSATGRTCSERPRRRSTTTSSAPTASGTCRSSRSCSATRAGLTLAHDRALVVFDRPRDATRSQYWMLAVMVAFTSLGLWLLSAAAQ